jgi:trk system potassium uptake protein TrkH
VEKETQKSVVVYFSLYMFCILAVFFLLSFDGFDLETNFSAAVSCFNNIGPAYGRAFAGYGEYSFFSKWVLSFAMLLGRLEIWPILLIFSPSVWISRR